MTGPLIVSYCVKHWANGDLPLSLMGALFLLGALAWRFVNPRRPVFE